MDSHIIDTNVLVVANGKHSRAKVSDIFECQKFLNEVREKHISIDSLNYILEEYFRHASRKGQPGIGDAFVKWLWVNHCNPLLCERVEITPDEEKEFKEFPDDKALKNFDHDDRKFVAVAVGCKNDPVICNASDSDWWDYKEPFERIGIKIKFLTPGLIKTRD